MGKRSVAIGAAAAVLVAAGLGAWFLVDGDNEGAEEAHTQVALPPVHRPGRIPAKELKKYPPIALVLADSSRASSSASGDLYTVSANGGDLRRVKAWPHYGDVPEDGVYGVYDARWSPDRRLIALDLGVYLDDPGSQAGVISPSGARLRRLGEANDAGNLAWSRQGALAYTNEDALWVASTQTGRPRRIRNTGSTGSSQFGLRKVEWAPDGKRLVLETLGGLAVVTLGGKRTRLTRTDRDISPRWSPNGREVAFVHVPSCDGDFGCKAPSNVYLVRADGSGRRRLTEHAKATDLRWSPSGSSILVNQQSPDGGITEGAVIVVGADGRHVRRVAHDATAFGWSPDGTKVLYSHGNGLWLMDADGGRPTLLRVIGRGRRGLTIVAADWAR